MCCTDIGPKKCIYVNVHEVHDVIPSKKKSFSSPKSPDQL